jgi:predicted dehydrogenase
VTGRLGVALLGAGRWGRQLARVLDARGELVVAWTRTDGDNANHLRQHHPRVRHTTDLQRAIEDPAVQALVIATPIATHAALAEAGLRAGKHVFVEKPLCTDSQVARSLVALAETSARVLFVGHVFLYHAVFDRLRALTRDRRVTYLRTCWRKLGTFDSDLLWNLGVHEVSLALALFGRLPVRSTVLHERGLVTACDQVMLRLAFDTGECLVDIDRCARQALKSVTVLLEGGEVLLWQDQTLARLDGTGRATPLFEADEPALDREVAAFVEACQRRTTPLSDGRHGAAVVEVVAGLVQAQGAT